MSSAVKLSIVTAVQHAQGNLPDILRSLRPPEYPQVEYLFCHTAADPRTPEHVGGTDNVRVLCGASDELIPHLWRDGILVARGERVATTSASCIPNADWVDTLLAADLENAVGVGGAIENEPTSDAMGWAVFLLRYAQYAPLQAAREAREIAADNAVYRRTDLLRHRDLLARGFWEPSFHARFREKGLRLKLEPKLRVVHRNRYSARQFFAQRVAHGREFGLARASRLPVSGRLLLTVLTPLLPWVFLCKIIMAAYPSLSASERRLMTLLWLSMFLFGWSTGEAQGYLASLRAGSGEVLSSTAPHPANGKRR